MENLEKEKRIFFIKICFYCCESTKEVAKTGIKKNIQKCRHKKEKFSRKTYRSSSFHESCIRRSRGVHKKRRVNIQDGTGQTKNDRRKSGTENIQHDDKPICDCTKTTKRFIKQRNGRN